MSNLSKHCFFISTCITTILFFNIYAGTKHTTANRMSGSVDVLVPDKKGFSAFDRAILDRDGARIQDLLDGMVIATVPKEQFTTDISLGIVDLKFDGETLKICELGEAPRSMFKGFDKLYSQGLVWKSLWHFLSCLNVSTWFIVNGLSSDIRLETALNEYESLGGRYARNLQELSQDDVFVDCLKKKRPGDYFSDYNAVVVMRNNCYRDLSFRVFKKKQQKALMLCEALGPFGNDKLLMNSLFERDEALQKYRPKCLVLTKKYSKKLVKKIFNELSCDWFVIKPINSSKGNGIIIVKRCELNKTLKAILKDQSLLPDPNDPAYGHWLRDRNASFLIEEYAPSKLITVNGEKYDATMRVIFMLFCDKSRIGITFLGSYWKLPIKSVTEPGGLTEKHKSSIKPDKIGSAVVDVKDYEMVKEILKDALPKAYIKMLQDRENYYKKWQIG